MDSCPYLENLVCRRNQLVSITELQTCVRLTTILCSDNNITTLLGLDNCINLQSFSCRNNPVTTLEHLNAGTLIELHVDYCSLTTFQYLNAPLLQTLGCTNNRLTTLEDLRTCLSLKALHCDYNQLTSFEGIEACTQLEHIGCYENPLVTVRHLIYLPHLAHVWGADHLWDENIQTSRFRTRMLGQQIRTLPQPHTRKSAEPSIYGDKQNVHDFHIQKSVCDSVQRLLLDPKPTFTPHMLIDSDLDPKAIQLAFEYCSDTSIHTQHYLSYEDLLAYVWQRITYSKHRDELIKILGEQICDAECKCFTGRFNRTLSVLVGFCSDIVITISDTSRISAIILTIGASIDPYDSATHVTLAQQQLLEAGYSASAIKPWLQAITDADDD